MNLTEQLDAIAPYWRDLFGEDPEQAAEAYGIEEQKPTTDDGYWPRTGDGGRSEDLYDHVRECVRRVYHDDKPSREGKFRTLSKIQFPPHGE